MRVCPFLYQPSVLVRKLEDNMRDSKLERRIYSVLKANGVSFSEEYEFPGLVGSSGRPLRFDFCVFEGGRIAYLIEAQGRQHYVPVARFGGAKALAYQKRNDVSKRRYCLDHGYRLVTIPYYDEDKIDYDYILRAAGR